MLFELILILPKNLVEIKLASIFSFFAVVSFLAFLAFILLSGRSQYDPADVEDYLLVEPSYAMLSGVASVVTAFGFHPLAYPVYLSL